MLWLYWGIICAQLELIDYTRSLVIAGFQCCFVLCVGCVRKTKITGVALFEFPEGPLEALLEHEITADRWFSVLLCVMHWLHAQNQDHW